MEKIQLQATLREETGKKVHNLRQGGQLPAVLYGHKVKNKNLMINYLDFEKVYRQAGGSTLIDLQVNKDKSIKVLIQDVQADALSDRFLHVDFHQVRMDEKITAEIDLKFIGEPPAEKELGGILVKNFDKIEVECLPQYLVHEIIIDVSKLKTFEDDIKISDLALPEEIQVLKQASDIVAHVLPPKSEEEIQKELAEGTEEKVEEVEVAEKGKKEEGEAKKEGASEKEPVAQKKPKEGGDKKNE